MLYICAIHIYIYIYISYITRSIVISSMWAAMGIIKTNPLHVPLRRYGRGLDGQSEKGRALIGRGVKRGDR